MPTSRSSKPLVLVTIGDPSGIGPEVSLKALAQKKVQRAAHYLVVGDPYVIVRTARDLSLPLPGAIVPVPGLSAATFSYGISRARYGRAAMAAIDRALGLLADGCADALVTAPINKASVERAGFKNFQGHTEYLAAHTGAKPVAMMFVSPSLKVTLVTRHVALGGVPRALSRHAIVDAIMLTYDALVRRFDIRAPRIGVCGLNPHAGEGGMFGTEEASCIVPAIRAARSRIPRGVIAGPSASDTIYHDALTGAYDAIIALYHDQGLIPFKLLHFFDGVNMTLGLPFVRTSPDHGTAFAIAGKGVADARSMAASLLLAARLAALQRRQPLRVRHA